MAQILTVDEAKQRLEEDIAKAHELFEKRVARIRELESKPLPEPGTSSGGRNWARYERALELREGGAKLADVGRALGVSVSRARQMIETEKRRRKFTASDASSAILTVRAYNILRNEFDLPVDFTREQVVGSVSLGKLKKANGCGASSINDIRKWLRRKGLDLRP